MPDPTKEQEYREEAERLAQLSIADQRAIIAQHRTIAADPEVTKADSALALERADALERHLRRLARRKKTQDNL
jgi:hypothetical protein